MKKVIFKFSALVILVFAFIISVESCKKDAFNPTQTEDKEPVSGTNDLQKSLAQNFTTYKLVTLNAAEMFNQVEGQADKPFTLKLADNLLPQSKIDLKRSLQLSKETEYIEVGEEGKRTNHSFDIRSYKTEDKQQKGMFVLSKDFFSANITLSDIEYHIEPVIMYFNKAAKDQYIVYKQSDVIIQDTKECATTEIGDDAEKNRNIAITRTARSCWKLELRSEGDFEYYTKAGWNFNLAVWAMAVTMSNASIPYDIINLDLVVAGITVYSSSPTRTSGYTGAYTISLLNQMRQNWSAFPHWNRDAVILYTGKDIYSNRAKPSDKSTVGQVFGLSVLCVDLNRSYAVVEWGNEAAKITSHEVGHLLSARHGSQGIMISSLPADNYFSQTSQDQMNRHIWFNHSCLQTGNCE